MHDTPETAALRRFDQAEFHVLAARVRVAQAQRAEGQRADWLTKQALEHLDAAHEAMGGRATALRVACRVGNSGGQWPMPGEGEQYMRGR